MSTLAPPRATWRQALAALLGTVLVLAAIAVVVRSDGIEAVDAASARATRWFVHEPSGRVVLVDGYGGRAVASLDGGNQGEQLSVVEGAPGAFVLNDSTSEVRAIDTAELRLGAPVGLRTLGPGVEIAGVGQSGLVVVDVGADEAALLPTTGESIDFEVEADLASMVARDGSVWSLIDGELSRTTSTASTSEQTGAGAAARLSLVGTLPLVLDAENRRARLGDGRWVTLDSAADPSEFVAQSEGPTAECGWVGADDDLWCVGRDGIDERATIPGLDIDGSDRLAISGNAAALVRRGPSSVVRFDWRAGLVLDEVSASVSSDASLEVSASVDLVWVDDTRGDFVWAVNPWSIRAVDKNPAGILVLGDDGDVVDTGQSGGDTAGRSEDSVASDSEFREPDDDGVDDPPVAVDDQVTARSGSSVPIEVTANDYDPDGEAIVVHAVGVPGHGTVDVSTATTVVYSPEPGYVGLDEFSYTIVDGDGTEASAAVVVELLAADATNSAPVGAPDLAETGAGVPVTVDVLLNDVDPERDSLRIGSFSPPEGSGEVTESEGPSGLPALRFVPAEGFEGTAVFSYRPVDSFDAVGDDVEVRVEVARPGDDNRPPIARPDAVRTRRGVVTPLAVLVNDVDPDGDDLELTVVEPLPPGLDVDVDGRELDVLVGPGSADLLPFQYEVDDGNGHVVRAAVLVDVIDDSEPNRPPVVSADSDKAVVGSSVVIDVTDNDIDPDGDPLVVVDVTQPDGDLGRAVVFSAGQVQFTPAPLTTDDEQVTARFTYTVADGNGHEVVGEVTVTVLPEAVAAPPFAQDDSASTFVDVPVTIDVLRNDGDPSGGRPSLVGRPGCPAGGRAVVTTDSQVRFDPPAGRDGSFRCTYEVVNSQGLRASASIIVSVREPELTNEPPVAVLDPHRVETGTTTVIDVTANDTDRESPTSALRVVSSTAPSLGTAERVGNSIRYTAGFETGVTTINYQVADPEGAVSVGRLSITVVEPVNVEPIAIGDSLTIFGPGVPTSFSVLDNDSDPDGSPGDLSVRSVERLSGSGTVSLAGDVVTIVPEPSFVGQVVATYTIVDARGATASATVTLTIEEPLNRAPDARDDVADIANGATATVPVLFNDVDPDGDALTVSIVSGPDPTLGAATLTADQTIRFVSEPGRAGTAAITYRISDGELSDTAIARVTVRPCAESTPVALDAFLRTGYQQPIAVNLNEYAANGSVVDVVGPPSYSGGVYTPPAGENGNVTINYGVVNSCRQRASGTITIDVNQDPVVSPLTIDVGRGLVRDVPVGSLASDSEPLTIVGSTGAPAWVTTGPNGLVISPELSAPLGAVSWTTVVRDTGGLSGTVRVTAIVTNRTPTAVPDSIDVADGAAQSATLVANDVDPDGAPGGLVIRTVPGTISFPNGGTGTVTLSADRRGVTIDPADGAGTTTFSYTIEDPDGGVSGAATVTVVGPRFNTAPFANDQSIDVTVDVATTFRLDAGDVDGDPISVRRLVAPGPVDVRRDGLDVTVTVRRAGTWTIRYVVRDDLDESREATVTILAVDPPTTTTTTPAPPPTTTPPPPTTTP